MYAVVATGGKQYKVREGQILRVEKIPGDIGASVSFDNVLMYSDGEAVTIGQPELENVAVTGTSSNRGKPKKLSYSSIKGAKDTAANKDIDSSTQL